MGILKLQFLYFLPGCTVLLRSALPPAQCLTFTAARTTPATRTRTRTGRTPTRTRTATATVVATAAVTGRRDAAAFVAAPCKAHRVLATVGVTRPAEHIGDTASLRQACSGAK